MKILVLDDNHVLAQALSDHLSEHGHRVVPAYEGRLGSILCERKDFDLIVIDLILPDVNGIDVLEQLQRKDRMPRAIVMSGFAELLSEVSPRMEALHVEGVLQKPFSFSDLDDLLTRVH
ncbi:MAG: response regulator [Thiocapsa sp.]|jgi:DNA-binding response OmpR family regulator|nr:response regulator [Thiocapsa sp.]MCG6895813.1 response regulator [Thiocapsa sp.]MCG6985758.1 response regulator [Thiocapsa sp.]